MTRFDCIPAMSERHRCGEKGFSKLVQQALNAYLTVQVGEHEKRRRALMFKEKLDARDAHRLGTVTREIQASW